MEERIAPAPGYCGRAAFCALRAILKGPARGPLGSAASVETGAYVPLALGAARPARARPGDIQPETRQGALVKGIGVPFDRLSAVPETVTGADGWATIRFRLRASFKPTSGEFVVVILRARKPGGSILAGVAAGLRSCGNIGGGDRVATT